MVVDDAHMFPGFLTPVLTQLSLQSHRLLFSHASAEVTGEKTLERKIDSTGYQTYNHQVLSPTSVHEKKLAEVQNRDSSFINLLSLNELICQGFAYLFSTQSQLLMTMKKKPFENIVGKEENAGNQHFLLFLQCSLFYPEKKIAIWFTFNLSSANALNMNWSEIFSFGKEFDG